MIPIMRQLRYSVASSLDGFIAGPNGEYDWIPMDPDIDFAAMYAGFSGLVMGRRSYEVSVTAPGAPGLPLPTYVYSRTLPEGVRDGVTFVRPPYRTPVRSSRPRASRSGSGAAASCSPSSHMPDSWMGWTSPSYRSCSVTAFP